MEKSKVKYGQIFGVPIYFINLDKCDTKIEEDQYPDWFAAFVTVPSICGSRHITKSLEAAGADFVFLNHEESDNPKPKLLPHDIEVPVYELDNTINGEFISKLQEKGDGTILTITMPFPMSVNGTTQ